MIAENPLEQNMRKCFIIDSKYYSYKMLRKPDSEENESEQESVLVHGSIPGTDSIQKQVTYAQYIDSEIKTFGSEKREKFRFRHSDIFNVFILPANNIEENVKIAPLIITELNAIKIISANKSHTVALNKIRMELYFPRFKER